MTRDEVRRIVLDVLEEKGVDPDNSRSLEGSVSLYGACSKKMVGDIVGEALLHSRIVVVDGRGVRSIAGTKIKT